MSFQPPPSGGGAFPSAPTSAAAVFPAGSTPGPAGGGFSSPVGVTAVPTNGGVFPTGSGPPTSGVFPTGPAPTGGVPPGYPAGAAAPPRGMFPPRGPGGGVMGMRPPAPHFHSIPPSGILPMPPMPPGVMMQMQPPMRPMSPIISAPPNYRPRLHQTKIPVISPSVMKVATTVFVGNISEKSSDTLLRQILLRCGRIEGWKRVQDASGKLQGFGFCEYGDPESTLRALRILHDFKLGEKCLVVKVDSKTRVDLLKYILKKKQKKDNDEAVDEEAIAKEVEGLDEKQGTEMLKTITDETQKEADGHIITAITTLAKENVEVLGDMRRSAADAKLEKDVKEALFAIAKQQGKVDPDSTLDDMDMEDDMKTLVSGEIKKFRQSSERQVAEKQKLRERERERKSRDRVGTGSGRGEADSQRERSQSPQRGGSPTATRSPRPHSPRERGRERDGRDAGKGRGRDRVGETRTRSPRRERSPIQRERSPLKRRSRTPSPRSRARERHEKEAQRKEKEREDSLREEENFEERQRMRKQREREKAYKERLSMWESRERRKAKDHDKGYEKEELKKEEMEREGRDLAEFLEDYNDEKDDQRYYKGSQYARRRRERELEKDEDERDRQREKEEIEALRLEVMERQVKERKRGREDEEDRAESTGSSSPRRGRVDDEEEEGEGEDVDMPKVDMEEDIPLAKTGFSVPQPYPPIQVQSAPVVEAPELKTHPRDRSAGDGITIEKMNSDPMDYEGSTGGESLEHSDEMEDMDIDSPRAGVKMLFGVRGKGAGGNNGSNSSTPLGKRTMDNVLGGEDEGEMGAPKRMLASIKQIEREQRNEKRALEREVVGRMARRFSGEDRKKIPAEERKKMIQTLVSGIPTTKEELFEYELKWDAIDQTLMEKRIGPWINKKIVEYIGEEEPTLTDFICNKLSTHIPAQTILAELAMVLDEEAEVFVVKLWRLLIYETEAKHLGIAKTY